MTDLTLPLNELPDPLPIAHMTGPFDVSITPPGSKSLTNRAYVLAALAVGESRIVRPLRADDTDRVLAALQTLGAGAEHDGDDVVIRGVGGRFPAGGTIDLGDGGTPTRFMLAVAALATDDVVVDGSPRMRARPVAEGVDLLRALGASIDYVEVEGRLPVRVSPTELRGGVIEVPTTASSQFISALMLIGPLLPGGLELRYGGPVTSEAYVTMTEGTLRAWGVDVRHLAGPRGNLKTHFIRPGAIEAREYAVAPDASSATYWRAAAAMVPGSHVRIPGLGRNVWQPDLEIGRALVAAGADDTVGDDAVETTGPPRLTGFEHDAEPMPDGALALAVVAAAAVGPSMISGLHTLRVKETDRIVALTTELRRIGCTVMATDDTLSVDPSTRHHEPVVIRTYNDHRMAMAFALLGLVRPGIAIEDPACVAKSYPTFWRDLASIMSAP